MQVPAINNQINFKAIYKDSFDIFFSKDQNSCANDILTKMRTPLEKYNGRTAEEYYKSCGLDFVILRGENNTVKMKACTSYKSTESFVYKDAEAFEVGVYNKEKTFDVKDIDTKRNKFRKTRYMMAFVFYIPIVLLALGAASWYQGFSGIVKDKGKLLKPLIENTDSVKNSLNKDTFQLKPKTKQNLHKNKDW